MNSAAETREEHVEQQTLGELERFAQGLSKRVLQCRIYGCQKQPSTVHEVPLEGSRKIVWETVLVCRNRCGAWWDQLVDPTNGRELTRLRKHYPKTGWLAPGIGRIYGEKKAVLRLENIKREYQLPEQHH